MDKVTKFKIKWSCASWYRIWTGLLRRELFNVQTLITVLSLPFFFFLVSKYLGNSSLREELAVTGLGIFATLTAVSLVIIGLAFYAAMRVGPERRSIGDWHGGEFHYSVPKLVFTRIVSAEQNDRPSPFTVPDARPGFKVSFRAEVESAAIKASVTRYTHSKVLVLGNGDGWDYVSNDLRLGIKMPEDGIFYLHTKAKPKSVAAVARVYVYSWTVQ